MNQEVEEESLLSDVVQNAITVNVGSLQFFWPEILLTAAILLIVAVDLILTENKKGILTAITLLVLVGSLFSISALYDQNAQSLFMGMVALDNFALFFKLLFVITTIVVTIFGLQSPDIDEERIGEFYAILLSVVLGAFLMVSATNLLMMYLSLELVSLPSFVLAGYQKRVRRSSEIAETIR